MSKAVRPGAWRLGAVAALFCPGGGAFAQAAAVPTELAPVEVVSPGPLPGLGLPRDRVPANVQTATAADLERRQSLDLASHLSRTLGSVTVNELQGNPFQPDLNFRGFTASPLLGTPQGLSVYLDGVRLNQPFGDVVGWDLVPRAAIASIALMPGSNPLFGLNTLGGAIAVRTKDGLKNPGSTVQASIGSHQRRAVEFETGGGSAEGWSLYLTGNRFHERGWRAASPSELSQLFAKVGRTLGSTDLRLSAAIADNDLTGNGLQEQAALQRDPRSVYTLPDRTQNRSVFLNLDATMQLAASLVLSGNAWFRSIASRSANGDLNADSLSQAVYQPDAVEGAALAGAGYTGFPAAGAVASNTPFPRWRCIADALLDTEPNETCNGIVNRTRTRQRNAGVALQVSAAPVLAGLEHRLMAGAAFDASHVRFSQTGQFGYVEPDRSVTPVAGPGAFADGSQASENAFDARVELASRSQTVSVFASDTLTLDSRTHLSLSARHDRTRLRTSDGLRPGGGAGSLDGRDTYGHLNPAVGLTFAPSAALTVYAGANRGTRAPTSVELGCADPASPCKLPNSFAGDPPLRQVVTTTFEAGLRGHAAPALVWNAGVFRSDNRDDLLFVADNASGYGYFRNFGRTRRQGIEAGLSLRPSRSLQVGVNLSWLDATYRSAETLRGAGNSSNAAALAGFPGVDGNIRIEPGDRIPLLARRTAKLVVDWDVDPRLHLGADLNATAGANARGNENGLHRPDGSFYTGPGRSAGYALLNLSADFRPSPRWKFFAEVTNLLDRRYATAAQLGANGFDANGHYIARSLPRDANGDDPVPRGTFLAPGAPRGVSGGLRYSFDG